MTVLTEQQHAGEFLVSEGNGSISRESGTLLSGQVVIDGEVAILAAGKLKAGTGASGEDVVGIFYGAHDATGADKPSVPYIARLAEVKEDLVTAEDGTGNTVDWDALNALFIFAR
jgi:hypothetical protein